MLTAYERLLTAMQKVSISLEKEHGELVEYVRESRSAEQRRREAGLVTRAKWWAFGMLSDGSDG